MNKEKQGSEGNELRGADSEKHNLLKETKETGKEKKSLRNDFMSFLLDENDE